MTGLYRGKYEEFLSTKIEDELRTWTNNKSKETKQTFI
jgi:hypothetical protein